MHKHAADYTKPCLNDLERAAAISGAAIIPDTKVLRESIMHTAAISEKPRIPDTRVLGASRMLADAISEKPRIPDTKVLGASRMLADAISENAKEHIKMYYDRDLDHRSTKESNDVIEDDNKVITLAASSQHQITEAPTSLREEVNASQDSPSPRQTEILEQLESPSEQVKLAPPEQKVGRIKSILTTLATVLNAGDGLAKIWSECGDAIKNFFGMCFGILAETWSQWSDAIKNFFGMCFGILAETWSRCGDVIKNLLGI